MDDSEVARYLASYLAANVLRFGDIEQGEHTAGMMEPYLKVDELATVIKEFYNNLP